MEALLNTGDSDFVYFVLTVLQDKCPFYEPDGATYRKCLDTFVDIIKEATQANAAQVTELNNDCLDIFAKYKGTLIGTSLVTSCVAYKLSNIYLESIDIPPNTAR